MGIGGNADGNYGEHECPWKFIALPRYLQACISTEGSHLTYFLPWTLGFLMFVFIGMETLWWFVGLKAVGSFEDI